MSELLFNELVNINTQNEKNDDLNQIISDLFHSKKLKSITTNFQDPEILEHFISRVKSMMYDNDAFSY